MILVIDIGNTNSVIGIYKNDQLVLNHRISTEAAITADELKIKYANILEYHQIDADEIKAMLVATVVPDLSRSYINLARDFFACECLFVSDFINDLPFKLSVPNPDELGDDRIVNAVSAYNKYQDNLIIIDFGTAITFDIVTKTDGYIGGVIYPGINLAINYLADATAKLPKVGLKQVNSVVGKTTIDAMESGIYNGNIAMIEGMVKKIQQEYDAEFTIVATGGMGKIFYDNLELIKYYNPDLTLEGLYILYKMKK